MLSPLALSAEANRYEALATQLKLDYAEIDDETLADTMEGVSNLPDLLQSLVRSSLFDDALVTSLKSRLSDMKDRLERLEQRYGRKRELVCNVMTQAGLDKLLAEDFSVSLRQSPQRLELIDESKVPPRYFVPQPPRLDRASLLATLKCGETIEGASLQAGQRHIQVRTK